MNRVISWDRKQTVLTAAITGAGTAYYELSGKARYFQASVVSASANKVQVVRPDITAPTYDAIIATLDTDQTYTVKAVSANYKCALIYESVTPALKTCSFDLAATGSATIVDVVTASLYSGITLTNAATTFAVSDDCTALRINNVIIHKSSGTFYADDLPTGVASLTNPAFTADFSMLFTDTAVYYYTAKSGATNGIYTLDRNDTFYETKRVERQGNNYLVYSQRVSNVTFRDWKLQFYTIASSLSTKIG